MERKFRLRAFREIQGLKQVEMAAVMGTSQSVISRMEMRDTTKLSEPQLIALQNRFKQEELNKFFVEEENGAVVKKSKGRQVDALPVDKVVSTDDSVSLEIIKEQHKTLSDLVMLYAQQAEKNLALLDKLIAKLQ